MNLGEMTAATDLYFLQEYGDATSINGVAVGADGSTPLKAFWDLAQPGRVSAFLAPETLGKAAYEVKLPAYVLDAPFLLKTGSKVVNLNLKWECAVHLIDPMGTQDITGLVTALVVMKGR